MVIHTLPWDEVPPAVCRGGAVSVTLPGRSAEELAGHLAARQIYAWSGNFYAVELTERLGVEDEGGLLRLGLVHYNTADEIDRLMEALDEFE